MQESVQGWERPQGGQADSQGEQHSSCERARAACSEEAAEQAQSQVCSWLAGGCACWGARAQEEAEANLFG